MRKIHATPLSANPTTKCREIIINSHNVRTKLAHHDVSAGANNVSHYLLISPITSHNILCPPLPLITGACPSWHSRQFSSISMDIKIPRTRDSPLRRRIHPGSPDWSLIN